MKNFNLAKKMLALALGVLMLLSVMTGCSKTNDQAGGGSGDTQQEQTGTLLKKIKDSGKLVVGTEAQYAPYEFKDLDANFVGCDMWLAQQIADSLGVQLEVVDMSFDGIIPAVQSGQVDLGIAAFTNTPERAKEIDFSNLYETSAQLLIVKAGGDRVDRSDLSVFILTEVGLHAVEYTKLSSCDSCRCLKCINTSACCLTADQSDALVRYEIIEGSDGI